ncbi:metalloregulator ArsR/SmtB family transcription factor [Puia sp.]|jgi:DNA-binding transcriptional ArsR family regulator|uniref:ArsR/SmtB family transcription factor n=1 Tax=Puia sp. TaxID=2045100 RepID=UPI002F3E7E06
MDYRRDVFHAIADPTRREIIGLLARSPLNLNAIAENFDVSRQAVSLHVKVLIECGLIEITKQGRERHCAARLSRLNEVSVWIEQYKKHFEEKLDTLDSYLQTLKQKDKHAKRKK